jgi:hypothetical protein
MGKSLKRRILWIKTHLSRYTPTGTYTGAKRGERDCYETLKVGFIAE